MNDDADKINYTPADYQQNQEIDLYIGVFFDGTNNNKYQTMLGKMFRRKEILKGLVDSANKGNLSKDQINYLERNGILKQESHFFGKKYAANINYNKITACKRNFWMVGNRTNGLSGILSKSQLDQLYFGYENSSEEDANFIEQHNRQPFEKTLDASPESHVLSSVAENPVENCLLQSAACDFVEGKNDTNEKIMKDAEGAFAQNTTYTNVAILESLYKLKSKDETVQHFSVYVEGSGADMVILPGLNNTYRRKADFLAYNVKSIAKVASQLLNTPTIDIMESLFECGVDWVTPELLPKALDWLDDIAGLGFGVGPTGVVPKSRKAAGFVAQTIDRFIGHRIRLHFDLFGFSRGSTTARMFNYAIDACRDNDKKDAGRANEEERHLISGHSEFVQINNNIVSKEVRLLGIFDTVSSIGVYRNGKILNELLAKRIKGKSELFKNSEREPYHDRNVYDFGLYATDQAKEVFHVCALDEVRQNFALVDIESSVNAKNGLELFVPGCHTDIGGGAGIGRETPKVINVTSWKGVRNYFCTQNSMSYERMKYEPLDTNSLVRAGWIDYSQFTDDDTMTGRPSGAAQKSSDDTVVIDNSNNNNIYRRRNIILNRYVTPGYSNVSLCLMYEKGGSKMFKQVPNQYSVPADLEDYCNSLKGFIGQKGRIFANPSPAAYHALRSKYLHLSANDQILSFADNLIVNPPSYVMVHQNGTRTRFSSRIIYHGEKKEQLTENKISYMFDYRKKGENVTCDKLIEERQKELKRERKRIQLELDELYNKRKWTIIEMKKRTNMPFSNMLFSTQLELNQQIDQKDRKLKLIEKLEEEMRDEY